MALSTVDNTAFETALTNFHTATALPYGPYTRVGSVPDVAPNSNFPVHVTADSAGDAPFYITYEQLVDTNRAEAVRLIEQAMSGTGGNANLVRIGAAVKAISDAITDTGTTQWTDAEYMDILRMFSLIAELEGITRWHSRQDLAPRDLAVPSITVTAVDGGSQEIDFSVAIDDPSGYVHAIVVNVNSGEHIHTSFRNTAITTQAVAMAGGADDYDVVVTAMGPGGVITDTTTVTVA